MTHNLESISPRDFGLEILDRLEKRHDIRLRPIVFSEALSVSEKRERLTLCLLEAVVEDLARHWVDDGLEPPFDPESGDLDALVAAASVEVEPNLIYREADALRIRGYQGDQLKTYVFGLTERLELMSNAKTPDQLARDIVAAGLVSVGVAMAVGTAKALAGGAGFLAAVGAGITGIGMATAIGVVVVILAILLLFLLLENPKKILGIVFNDSDENWVVHNWRRGVGGDTGGDLFMQHGSMESFPEDHETERLDSPKVQLRKRFFFAPGDADNSVCAGLFFADKSFGFRGSEGIMVLTASGNSRSVALQFAVPYTNDNGTNIEVLGSRPSPGSLPDRFRSMFNSRRVRIDRTEDGYRVVSTVNHPRGGVVALIASIQKV